jgi:hypothetical protein
MVANCCETETEEEEGSEEEKKMMGGHVSRTHTQDADFTAAFW